MYNIGATFVRMIDLLGLMLVSTYFYCKIILHMCKQTNVNCNKGRTSSKT